MEMEKKITLSSCKKELEVEGKIDCQSLLQEVEPLIKDYFIGDFKLTEEGLLLKFLNGQTFLLTISEITEN